MTDVADWSRLTAGTTRTIATGTVECTYTGTPGRFTGNVTLTAIPATTRSVLVLATVTATTPLTFATLQGVTLAGNTTGREWPASITTDNVAGTNSFNVGAVLAPQYFPYYAAVDPAGTLSFTFNQDTTVEYWVLALPDADIKGTPSAPVMVQGSPWPSNPVPAAAADPRPTVAHTPSTASLAAPGTVNVLAAPPAGFLNEIVRQNVYVASGTSGQYLSLRGTTTGDVLLIAYSQSSQTEGDSDAVLYLSEGVDLVGTVTAGGNASIWARTVTQL